MMDLSGYKTALYNFIKVFGGMLVAMGAIPPEAIQFVINNIELSFAAYLAIDSVISSIIRHFTTSEPFWRRPVKP